VAQRVHPALLSLAAALPEWNRRTTRIPLLVCVADGDVYANPKFQAWVGDQAPLGVVKHYACGHFDPYHDWFEEVVRDQISFLQANLKGA
jgi:hypothetical protein